MRYQSVRGRNLSAMTLGTVQLGLNYGIANNEGKPSREKSFLMLRAALEAGITSLDTASAYGDSEIVLGDFLQQQWRGSLPVLTTKCKLESPEGFPASVIEKELTENVEASLERLGVRSVEYLLLHQASDMVRYGDIVPKTLKRLVQKGYFTTPGVSVYYANEIECMLQNATYCAVQLPMGILDQRLVHGGYLERLKQHGVDVFVRSVFQQGLCFMEPDAMEEDLRRCAGEPLQKLSEFAKRAQMSVAQFAVSFIRDLPGVTSLVLGADNPAQIKENVALLDGPEIPDDLMKQTLCAFETIDYEGIMAVLRKAKPQSANQSEPSSRIRSGGK